MTPARILLLVALAIALPAQAAPPTERFLFAVGANDGGPQRTRLRYAARDAANVAAVMQELGGVPRENAFLLEDPDRAAFFAAWSTLRDRVERGRRSGARTEVFFYYSGHSTEESLLWGGEQLDYLELRQALRALPADVVVAILDACASGAFTRMKGGALRPAFLPSTAAPIRGHAYLTSSAADEVAQESDRIGGSFFTHHLLAGLRGAADAKGTGRVTLNDAYRYAFEETLAQTERSRGGPQHPVYDIDLVGAGDLVVTDLNRLSATLDFDAAIQGRVFVRDARGDLVVEARKRPGVPLRLGLAPGAYAITILHGDNVYEASITLASDQSSRLGPADLQLVPAAAVGLRKGEVDREGAYRVVPFEFSVLPSLSTDNGPRPTTTRFSLYLLGADGDHLDGSQIGLGIGRMREDVEGVQLAGIGNLAGGDVDGLQAAGAFNHVGGSLRGVQMALGVNVVREEMDHLQMAGLLNLVYGRMGGLQMSLGPSMGMRHVRGMQMTPTYAHAGGTMDGIQIAGGAAFGFDRVEGVQLAAGASVARGDAQGVQLALGAAVTGGSFVGYQAAAGMAWTGEEMVGLQMAVGLAAAGKAEGAQIAPVTLAEETGGYQVGVVNLAGSSTGAQIGLINVAASSEIPVGLLNFIGDGRFRIGTWGSDLAIPHLSLKTGSRTVHSIVFAGLRPGSAGDDGLIWALGAGLGLHLEFRRLGIHFLEPELLVSHVSQGALDGDDHALVNTLRLGLGWDLARRLSVFLGPSLNVSVQEGTLRDEKVGFGPAVHIGAGSRAVLLWPGIFAGIEI
ncbi:MAG TPA: caspase family protein [Fredinandcohnia sp.]|nr:caspase family protein [Fredinandcohnia sp.]